MKSYLEQAFGRGDVTSARMQAAIREWLNLYYGTQSPGEDAADRGTGCRNKEIGRAHV